MYLIKPYLMFTNVFLVIKTHRNIAVCILTYDTEKSKYEKAAIFDLCYFQSGSASESNWWWNIYLQIYIRNLLKTVL